MIKRVLVADDCESLGEALVEILERAGYKAIWVNSPSREELEIVMKSFQPDAIMSDFLMIGVTGREVIRWAREISPGILAILMSTKLMEIEAQELKCLFVAKGEGNTDKKILEMLKVRP